MANVTDPVQALLVVDVQAAFFAGVPGAVGVPAAAALRAEIEALVARARMAGSLVVHLQHDGPAGAADEPGTPGWRLCLPVAEGPDEVVIRKTTDDAFHRTALADLLAARQVQTLAVCGVMSEMCLSATARTALSLGFAVVVPHGAHGTYDIPAGPGGSEPVPAAVVSRVAEWALGDGIRVAAGGSDVSFGPVPPDPSGSAGSGAAGSGAAGSGAAQRGVRIRPMRPTDAAAVLAIYQAGLDQGDASFEVQAPSWESFDRGRLAAHRLVAVDAADTVLGWVAVSAVSTRPVYAGVVEHSVYVDPAVHGRGVGRLLLAALIASTEAAGIWTIQSGVFPENAASLALHRRAGFRALGVRQRIGRQHGRWRDVVLLERRSPVVC